MERRNMKKVASIVGLALVSGTTALVMPMTTTPAQAAPYYAASSSATVMLNDQPLATSVPPRIVNGRTLVPMRDIFEALGATVVWNPDDRSITAQKDETRIWLQIGNKTARVENRQVWLDQVPVVTNGSTLVPLRFVSEAMGAEVAWSGATRVVSITTDDMDSMDYGDQVAGMITVPEGAVVPVTIDTKLSSETSRVGDTFWASVRSDDFGDSEFPPRTRIKGVVTRVSPKTKKKSGAITVEFTGIQLPNGHRQSIDGSLISLDKDDVTQTSSGRIIAKDKKEDGADATTVLIGAGAGYVLGHVLLDQNSVLSAALGALGGYLYGKNQGDEVKPQEAVVPEGTELGVRLDDPVRYEDHYGYENSREMYLR